MKLAFQNKRISGVLVILPDRERLFTDEMAQYGFPESRSLKLKEVMGYDRHRIVDSGTCISDLAIFGFKCLFKNGQLRPEEIDALIVVSQTPDYLLPPTSFVIHGELGLGRDVFCLDINQGCAGFIIGLFQSFMLLEQPAIRKVALVNADVLSRKVSTQDRNSFPLIGDAASITIVERSDSEASIHAVLKVDGSQRGALIIPAGGLRHPNTMETAILEDQGDGNFRAKDHLRMNGSAVFSFVQVEVPPMIDELLLYSGKSKDSIDYFVFHQPNQFMLQKLADKIGVPHSKVPMNVVGKYGNSSGVTIPTAIADNLSDLVVSNSLDVLLAGFGVGLTWAGMTLPLGPIDFCGTEVFDSEGD